jgi:hypothetical protein
VLFNGKKKKPEILLEGDSLEIVNAYKYLGVWFDSKLDWKLQKETILAKARRRAYTMMGFGVCKILPVKSCVNLWEVLVRPILEYAAEVWGDGGWEAAEKLQRKVGKLILGAPTRTANEVVLGDLGWWELKARRDKARLKLYKKLFSRRWGEYTRMLVDDIHGVWRQYSDELLQAIELDIDDMKLYSEMEWRNLLTTKMHAREEKRWRQGVQSKAKLRTYRTIKSKLRMEPYLGYKNRLARYLTTRLRSGTNFLRVETGRYEQESVEERLCGLCNMIEDEKHFLLDCDLYDNIRGPLWKGLKLEALSDAKKLEILLGSAPAKGATAAFAGQFIIEARKTREIFQGLL